MFDATSDSPEGLRYEADFVTSQAEAAAIDRIKALPLQPFQFGVFEGKRRISSFGFRYDYATRRSERAEPIRPWLHEFVTAVEGFGGEQTKIAQVLCTEYDVGVGIGWHRDKPHFDRIFGLSLGSSCKFRFRRKIGTGWRRFTLEAEPRSLYLITGESRRIWEHSIPAVEFPRYSITFRTVTDDIEHIG